MVKTYTRILEAGESHRPDDMINHNFQTVRVMSEEEYAKWVLKKRFDTEQKPRG